MMDVYVGYIDREGACLLFPSQIDEEREHTLKLCSTEREEREEKM